MIGCGGVHQKPVLSAYGGKAKANHGFRGCAYEQANQVCARGENLVTVQVCAPQLRCLQQLMSPPFKRQEMMQDSKK